MQNSGKGTKASWATVPSEVKVSEGSISYCKHFHKTVSMNKEEANWWGYKKKLHYLKGMIGLIGWKAW